VCENEIIPGDNGPIFFEVKNPRYPAGDFMEKID
jgi:hypothetical protein